MEDNFGKWRVLILQQKKSELLIFCRVMFATELLATAKRPPKNPKKKATEMACFT
jgi:hypothetical protein